MALAPEQYLLEHWKFNADQRLKTFNFFVAFSVFADGGVFAAIDRCAHPMVLMLLGGFIVVLAVVFALVDARCRALLHLSKEGLMHFEQGLQGHYRLFEKDRAISHPVVRLTVAFNTLFVHQGLFGMGVLIFGLLVSGVIDHGWGLEAMRLRCR